MLDLKRINKYMDTVGSSEKKTFKPKGQIYKTGLDLGTATIVLVVLDEDDNPLACETQVAEVLRDGVLIDYSGALNIVKKLKAKIEKRLDTELHECAIAMPPGTGNSARAHRYVAEGAGFNVTKILDEPTAANSVYRIENGVIVDIGGGTTGLSVIKDGAVTEIYDEATGGTHLNLVLAGNYKITVAEAEKIKRARSRHGEIFPIVRPVLEKMATIVDRHVNKDEVEAIYLCGGTCRIDGIEQVFEAVTGIKTYRPKDPFLVTSAGIAMNCKNLS